MKFIVSYCEVQVSKCTIIYDPFINARNCSVKPDVHILFKSQSSCSLLQKIKCTRYRPRRHESIFRKTLFTRNILICTRRNETIPKSNVMWKRYKQIAITSREFVHFVRWECRFTWRDVLWRYSRVTCCDVLSRDVASVCSHCDALRSSEVIRWEITF